MIRDITEGISGTDVRAGIISEIGISTCTDHRRAHGRGPGPFEPMDAECASAVTAQIAQGHLEAVFMIRLRVSEELLCQRC